MKVHTTHRKDKQMAKIDTLIEDIYKTLEDGSDMYNMKNKTSLEKFSKALFHSMARQMSEGKRQRGSNLRMSQIGKPDRQLWYELKSNAEPRPIDGQTKLKFMFGDILEALLILLIEVSGHKVTDEQGEVEINGVKGHKDCRIDGVLTDIKSASPYAFKKFKEGTLHSDDPFGYIAQISGYAEASGDDKAAFFAVDKSSGELALMDIESVHMISAAGRINKVKQVLTKDTPPERCYADEPEGKSGNRKLAIGCVFCSFREECWKDANGGMGIRSFKYSNGIKHLTTVAKVPDVPEVTNAL